MTKIIEDESNKAVVDIANEAEGAGFAEASSASEATALSADETATSLASDAASELAARLAVERALTANHANTLPMLEILRACDSDEFRPYREIEDEVYDLPVMQLSHQNAHTLSLLLVECGALEQTFVEEEPAGAVPASDSPDAGADAAPAVPAVPAAPGSGFPDAAAADAPAPAGRQLEDQPVDYLLGITAAGRAALDTFEPTKRYQRMMAGEPAGYREVYRAVLSLCEQGMRMDDIEARLAGMPAMRTPKVVYAGHFVSNLETVDGIAWDDAARLWKTTSHGLTMATL